MTMLCYLNISVLIYSVSMMWFMSESFDFFVTLDSTSLLLSAIVGVLLIIKTSLKYWAYQNEEASKLQIYSSLPVFYQLTCDSLLFGTTFTT